MKALPRLVNLAVKLKDQTPPIPYQFRRYIPQPELLDAAREGLQSAAEQLEIPVEQLKSLVLAGEDEWEESSPKAFRLALATAVMNNTEITQLPLEKKLKMLSSLHRYVEDSSSMIEDQEFALDEITEFPPIPKWNSGFEPIDRVTGGLYQALLVLMGLPGSGKTSHMLGLMENYKLTYPQNRILFFQQEIPGQLFISRMQPIHDRGKIFTKGDKLYTNKSLDQIIEIVHNQPDSKQIVFIDSPDAMSGPGASAVDGGRRFDLENIYRNLVHVKNRSELVVVASQPRRQDSQLSLQSVAESFAKAWYADIILGFWPIGNKLKMKTLKNRFGPNSLSAIYDFNFETLEYDNVVSVDDWGDFVEDD